MQTMMAITVIGPDRPGLVNLLAERIGRHDANWLESHMANLAGQFAGIVQVSLSSDAIAALRQDLESLSTQGLTISLADYLPASDTAADGRRLTLSLVGQDHAGIVSELTAALAANGVSIEELETGTSPASMAGGMLFTATLTAVLPHGMADDALDEMLTDLSHSLMMDIEIDHGVATSG